MYTNLVVEAKANGVTVVTLNQPKTLNALGVEISRELGEALAAAEADASTRVVVIRGAGRAFSSGGNLADMRAGIKDDPGKYMSELTAAVYGAIKTLMGMNKPVIAQVHGFAYGAAFNLVVACDLAVAGEDTVFCESFLKLGLIPGGYATLLLPAAIGMKRAMELCLTAREVPAAEALAMGLISRVVPDKELEARTLALAEMLAAAPPLAIQESKRLLRAAREHGGPEQARLEQETQIKMAQTKDFKEGLDAFFEKRKPRFEGK
jgi:2-(1,2-epoxy-1,2-dihydrophenyl)acetyl-CoA isomerase